MHSNCNYPRRCDRSGFRPTRQTLDRNSKGEFVIKTAGIKNESSHRAKCLSSDYVCQECKESLEAQRAAEATKAALGQQKLLALIDEAEQAKKKLLELMGKPATSSNNQLVHAPKLKVATAAPIIAAAPPVLEPVVVVPESGNGLGPQSLPSIGAPCLQRVAVPRRVGSGWTRFQAVRRRG